MNGFSMREIRNIIEKANYPIVHRRDHFYTIGYWRRDERSRLPGLITDLAKRILEMRKDFQRRIKSNWKKIQKLNRERGLNELDDTDNIVIQRQRHQNVVIATKTIIEEIRERMDKVVPQFVRRAPLQAFNISIGEGEEKTNEKEIEEYMSQCTNMDLHLKPELFLEKLWKIFFIKLIYQYLLEIWAELKRKKL
jgi:hypothetical protein